MMKLSKTTLNRLLLASLAGALVVLFYWGLRPQPVPVDLATVERGDLAVTVDEEGKTRIKEVFAVSAPVSGLLRRLSLQEGDAVQRDRTVVAVIEPIAPAFQDARSMSINRAQVQSAEAALALAEADLTRYEAEADNADAEFTRNDVLYRKRIIARKLYDQALAAQRTAKAAVQSAEANVEVRRKELDSAKANLMQPSSDPRGKDNAACCLSIKSPAEGRVLSLLHKSEQVVTAGTPLLEVGNDRDIELVVELLSGDAVKIKVGAEASVDGWGGAEALKAVVRRIEPAGFTKVSALGIEEQRVRVILDLVDGDEGSRRLGHDYRVYAHIKSWEGTDRLLVPLSALFRTGEDWSVYVYTGGAARLRKIRIDHRNQASAEVLEGLDAGERVITHPSDRIAEGVAVVERPRS
jgi:HlyD family secretion protein